MRKYNVKTELVTDGEVITPIEDEPSCSKKGRRKTQNLEAQGYDRAQKITESRWQHRRCARPVCIAAGRSPLHHLSHAAVCFRPR